jgi:hypothetical protein
MLSDTKELAWYLTENQKNVVTINTPRSQGLIGFIKANPKNLSNLAAEVQNNFGAILVNSLDSKPISNSGRILLTACVRAANSNMTWNEDFTATKNSGQAPSLIEPIVGKIILSNLNQAKSVSVKALDGAGQPVGKPIEGKLTKNGWEIEVGEPVTTWYEVTVSR